MRVESGAPGELAAGTDWARAEAAASKTVDPANRRMVPMDFWRIVLLARGIQQDCLPAAGCLSRGNPALYSSRAWVASESYAPPPCSSVTRARAEMFRHVRHCTRRGARWVRRAAAAL